jgi:hypothetical protein
LTIQQTIRSANIIDLSASALIVPRNTDYTGNIAGAVRYNTTSAAFEGYTTNWNSLGGVVSTNKYVKIDASNNPGLQFYTGSASAIERMRIDNSGNFQIYGDTSFNGNVSISDSNGLGVLLKFMSRNSPLVSPLQLGQDIIGEAVDDQSGWSVSMNSDGTIVAIGGYNNDGSGNNTGHVRVYKYDPYKLTNVTDQSSADFGPIGWRRLGRDIDGEAANDESGFSVSLSADGTVVAIGAIYNDGNGNDVGHVRVYKYVPSKVTGVTDQSSPNFGPAGWTQLGRDIDGEDPDDKSGRSVSLSADGTVEIGRAHV